MASVLVYIETDGDQPSLVSLQALGEGRRIATILGAALYAFVSLPENEEPVPAETRNQLVKALGRAGADKVILVTTSEHPGPPVWSTHGDALHLACDELRPTLVLLAANAIGRDMAPRLAARLGAAFVAEPMIECGPRGEIVFSRTVYAATQKRRLPAENLGQTVVATLTPNAYRPGKGYDEAELIYRSSNVSDSEPTGIEYLGAIADPSASLETASIVVVAGGGVSSFESYAMMRELADALGGEIAATRTLCAKGIAPSDREVGIGARSVAPEIYVICGASGSSATLGALSGDAEVIAINLDPHAPVFRIASYGIVKDIDEVVPKLIEALRDLPHEAATS